MNEPAARTVEFKAGERNIFFHILTACNLACAHCYINPLQHGRRPVDRATMLDWIKRFFDPAKTNNIVFLGGEPTLHKHLAKAITFAKDIGYETVTVDTNGYCHHDLLDNIQPGQAVFNFSLDGPTALINDALRGQGSFDVCRVHLEQAVARGFETSVIYTVSQRNIQDLERMPRLLADLKVPRFFIQVIGLRGQACHQDDPLQLTSEQWLTKVPEVARAAARLGITTFYPKVYLDPDEPFACAGNVAENFFIFPNGRVYCCPLCEDLPLHSFMIEDNRIIKRPPLTEQQLFSLSIPEGCVMNKLLQPDNIDYDHAGLPKHRISCCLLKNMVASHSEAG